MNEVRVLSNSLTSNDGRLVADTQIKLPADKSLLGYAVGDQIQVRQDDFARLAQAYFAEIETTLA